MVKNIVLPEDHLYVTLLLRNLTPVHIFKKKKSQKEKRSFIGWGEWWAWCTAWDVVNKALLEGWVCMA